MNKYKTRELSNTTGTIELNSEVLGLVTLQQSVLP